MVFKKISVFFMRTMVVLALGMLSSGQLNAARRTRTSFGSPQPAVPITQRSQQRLSNEAPARLGAGGSAQGGSSTRSLFSPASPASGRPALVGGGTGAGAGAGARQAPTLELGIPIGGTAPRPLTSSDYNAIAVARRPPAAASPALVAPATTSAAAPKRSIVDRLIGRNKTLQEVTWENGTTAGAPATQAPRQTKADAKRDAAEQKLSTTKTSLETRRQQTAAAPLRSTLSNQWGIYRDKRSIASAERTLRSTGTIDQRTQSTRAQIAQRQSAPNSQSPRALKEIGQLQAKKLRIGQSAAAVVGGAVTGGMSRLSAATGQKLSNLRISPARKAALKARLTPDFITRIRESRKQKARDNAIAQRGAQSAPVAQPGRISRAKTAVSDAIAKNPKRTKGALIAAGTLGVAGLGVGAAALGGAFSGGGSDTPADGSNEQLGMQSGGSGDSSGYGDIAYETD